MRIPSDNQIVVQVPRSGLLEALGLKQGQTFTAQVTGQAPGGATQLQVGNQQITLVLPNPPQLGQFLEFQIKTAGASPELILLGEAAKAAQPAQGAPANQPQNQLQAQLQTSSTALSAQSSAGQPTQAQPQQAAHPAAPQPTAPAPSGNAPSGGAPTPITNAPVSQSSLSITLPAATSASLNLQPGQLVTAQVVNPAPNGQWQITIGNQQFLAPPLPGNPPAGTILQFQVQTAGAEPRLVLVEQGQSGGPPKPVINVPSAPSNAGAPAHPTSPSSPPPVGAPITAASVQQTIMQTASTSVVRQDSVGTLLASLAGLQGKSVELPNPVVAAARQLFVGQVVLGDGAPQAEFLRDAVGKSGVFFETMMAQAQPGAAPQGDMKSMLLLLRSVLGNWLVGEEQLPPPDRRPPPPVRGGTPRSPAQNQPGLPDGASPREVGRHLLAQTDSALSRVRLFQLASLPDAAGRANPAGTPQEWNFELPFMLGSEMSMAQFQISRDADPDGGAGERGWQMVFSVNFSRVGEVGAKVSFRGRKTGVMMWAENEETAAVLEEMLPELVMGLQVRGLEPGSVRVRHGAPEAKPPRSGKFVDSMS